MDFFQPTLQVVAVIRDPTEIVSLPLDANTFTYYLMVQQVLFHGHGIGMLAIE